MELQHTFTVPVPIGEAAGVLHEVERLAPCMPGAVLDGFDGEEFTGRMSVKVGAITMAYKGKGRFVPAGDDGVALRVEAAETRGAGAVAADVVCRLSQDGTGTRVVVDTTVDISGKAAQFGRGVISEVGDRVVAAFATNLQKELAGGVAAAPGSPAAPPATTDAPRAAAAAPLDLGSVAGPVLLKRFGPAGLVIALVLAFLLGRSTAGLRITRG